MADFYTNASGRSGMRRSSVIAKPYVSKGSFSNLTHKERLAREQLKMASCGVGSGLGLGMGVGGAFGNTMQSMGDNFFSPQLSTDFGELPQSLREKREWYRHFYSSDELVGQAIDLHTELPLSKIRLAAPKPRVCPKGFKDQHNYGKYILSRFERMCKRLKLLQRLHMIVHHYWLDGTCLPPDEWVTVEGGVVRADMVQVGDRVLTHEGRWRVVTAVCGLETDSLVSLDIARLPGLLRVTPDHPVEVLDGSSPKFVPAGDILAGDWVRVTWPVEVEDIERVDLLQDVPSYVTATETGYSVRRCQQRPRTEKARKARESLISWLASLDAPVVHSRSSLAEEFGVPLSTLNNVIYTLDREVPEPFKQRNPRTPRDQPSTTWFPAVLNSSDDYSIYRDWSFEVPTEIPVTKELLYVLGYWLGDGFLSRDSHRDTQWGRGHWGICFGKSSENFKDRVEATLKAILGTQSVRLAKEGHLDWIYVKGHPAFVEWSSRNFGDTSHGPNPKRIPTWVLTLPLEKQQAFLAGLLDSDGCVSSRTVGSVSLGMTSLNVVSGARDIMLRLGAVPSFSKSDRPRDVVIDGVIRGYSDKPVYRLSVHDRASCAALVDFSLKKERLEDSARFFEKPNSYQRVGDNVYFLVRNTHTESGLSPVVNFQVQDDETFRARFVSTHNCAIFVEDSAVEVPYEVTHQLRTAKVSVVDPVEGPVERLTAHWHERANSRQLQDDYYQKHYEGWSKLIVLPIDRVKITGFNFTDKVKVELIPSNRDRQLVSMAAQGDPTAEEMVREIPVEVRQHLEQGTLIPMGTDPDEGSFVALVSGRKQADSELGQSILDRCMRTLLYREKLRQAQTSIASRAMTPKRIVWAEGLSDADVEALREQIDLALVDPDYSIVANYEIRWEEMGARDRLLDLSTEYEQTERRLISGLGVTESLMSGESLYSGDRLKLEVINQRYLHLREILQEYVEEMLFKPVARRMGFVETDEWGQEVVLYPRLSFTRLPLRDSQDTFDALYNLYQKGSVNIDVILELLNLDPDDVRKKIEEDMGTVNDAMFNEIVRSAYNEIGRMLPEQTDMIEKVAEYMKLQVKPQSSDEGGGGRF